MPTVLIGLEKSAPVGIMAVSCEARSLFGLDDQNVTGLPASELAHPLSTPEWAAALEQLTVAGDGASSTVEMTPRTHGGSAAEPADGQLPGMVAHLRLLPSGEVLAQFTTKADVDLANTAANKVLAEQKRFLAALLELGELAHSTQDDEDFFQRLLERTVSVVPGAQAGSIQLAIPDTTTFRFVAAVGFDLEGLQQQVLDKSHFFRDTKSPQAEIVKEFTVDERTPEITEWLETVGRLSEIKSNVSAPVLVDGVPVAFLSIDNFSTADAMTETSVEMMTVLARLIGDLYVRRELESEIRREREAFRHLALHDPVTGLANRRKFEQSLEDTLEASGRRGHPASVIFIDLDDFKSVNDEHGHDFGDRVLAAAAKALTGAVRVGDIVGRWGGDEFVVLPARLDSAEEAIELGERILASFSEPLNLDDGSTHAMMLTVGISWSTDSQVGPDQLVRTADEALYEAKADGKGTVRLRKV